jgi:hypothetical protein
VLQVQRVYWEPLEQRELLVLMVQLVLQELERKEAQVLREQGQPKLIFKFLQLPAHSLGLNHSTQGLLKLLLLAEVVVEGLDK